MTSRIHIALVNNMTDAAKHRAESQFRALLDVAAAEIPIEFSDYTLESIDSLWDADVDALIVTGREPLAARLAAEPYWNKLTELIEWAQRNTYSAIWSCLAAHAAVLHLDGIERGPLKEKLFGVFECSPAGRDPLASGIPSRWCVPHSRWNDIAADELEACGYRLITRSEQAGADTFIKQVGRSLFVFFQGHPEYDADTLWLEYRRDVRRFMRAERNEYPSRPCGDVRAAVWQDGAARLYRNWLQYLGSRKAHDMPRLMGVPLQHEYAQVGEVGR